MSLRVCGATHGVAHTWFRYAVMVHPHNYLLYYTKLLRGSVDVAQRAWGYLNDSLRLDLCCRCDGRLMSVVPAVVACCLCVAHVRIQLCSQCCRCSCSYVLLYL
jgi:hypothetical protein